MSASDHELIRNLSERRGELLEDCYLLSDSERAIRMLVWFAQELAKCKHQTVALEGMPGMSEHEASWLLGLVGENVDILVNEQSARQLMGESSL